jgi:disulfide oxidoreductase YuzD
MLQLRGSKALSSLEARDIPRAARELGADVSAGQYLHPDLQETYLRYANTTVNKDIVSEGNIKMSQVSKQVN